MAKKTRIVIELKVLFREKDYELSSLNYSLKQNVSHDKEINNRFGPIGPFAIEPKTAKIESNRRKSLKAH